MLNTQLSEATVNAQADATARLLDDGYVDVMDGTQPKSSDEAITTQKVLAVFRYGKPAFRSAVDGIIDANTLTGEAARASGKPTWYRAYRSDHKTAVFDGSAGKKGGKERYNMELPADTIIEGVTMGCPSLTHAVAKASPGY